MPPSCPVVVILTPPPPLHDVPSLKPSATTASPTEPSPEKSLARGTIAAPVTFNTFSTPTPSLVLHATASIDALSQSRRSNVSSERSPSIVVDRRPSPKKRKSATQQHAELSRQSPTLKLAPVSFPLNPATSSSEKHTVICLIVKDLTGTVASSSQTQLWCLVNSNITHGMTDSGFSSAKKPNPFETTATPPRYTCMAPYRGGVSSGPSSFTEILTQPCTVNSSRTNFSPPSLLFSGQNRGCGNKTMPSPTSPSSPRIILKTTQQHTPTCRSGLLSPGQVDLQTCQVLRMFGLSYKKQFVRRPMSSSSPVKMQSSVSISSSKTTPAVSVGNSSKVCVTVPAAAAPPTSTLFRNKVCQVLRFCLYSYEGETP